MNEIYKYSNPNIVKQLGNKYLNKEIYLSSRKDKKYMIQDPNGKWIHFGAMGYKDFTLTGDENQRRLFRQRNHKWAYAKKYSPAWLSYYLLW